MNNDIRIELPLPATTFTVTSVYQTITKASGIGYMLLKLIDYGNRTERNLTVSDLMNLVSVPSDLLPAILNELEHLRSEGMIDLDAPRFTKATSAKRISLTESGERMRDYMLNTSEPQKMEQELTYFPGRRKQFQKKDSMKVIRPKLNPDNVDEAALTDFVQNNKEMFEIRSDAQFVTKIRANDPKSCVYAQNVIVGFDDDTGRFVVKDIISDVNIDAIKQLGVTGDMILGKLPTNLFDFKPGSNFSAEWNDSVPMTTFSRILPVDFEMPAGVVVSKGAEGGMTVICSKYEGYRFWFTESNDLIEGFECGIKSRIVLRHRLSPAEIRSAIESETDSNTKGKLALLK